MERRHRIPCQEKIATLRDLPDDDRADSAALEEIVLAMTAAEAIEVSKSQKMAESRGSLGPKSDGSEIIVRTLIGLGGSCPLHRVATNRE